MRFSRSVLVWCSTFSGLIYAKDTAQLTTQLSKSLNWLANFSVGDAQDVELYISTVTADLILNPGVYKPSGDSKPYNGTNGTSFFRHTYNSIGRSGLGFESWSGKAYTDVVSAAGLAFDHQALGSLSSFRYYDINGLPNANPGNGIIGFANAATSVFTPGAPSWFYNLAKNKITSQTRFGTALGTSGRGILVLGELAKNLFKGPLTTVPRGHLELTSSSFKADITVNGEIWMPNQIIVLDAGTANIAAPLSAAKQLFDKLGYRVEETKVAPTPGSPAVENALGYFECVKPPTIGFSLPAQRELGPGQKAKNFNLYPSVWDVYRDKNNSQTCASIILGTNMLTTFGLDAWLVGQPIFQGHYIDFDIGQAPTIGFADLVDPSMSS